MNFLKFIKQILLILLTFFLGAQTTYAKTEPVLPQYKLSFSIEQTQSLNSLEKEVQPNIGFLKEKIKFGKSKGISAQNQHKISEYIVGYLANAGSNWFSLSSFKNITAKIPGGANKTNIGKTLWNDAYKITPTNGSSAKNVVDDIIANGDNLGAKTEGLVDDIMTGQGYQIADGKYFGTNGTNGYDGFYYKGTIDNPSEIIIIESKQMSATLGSPNAGTGLPSQMSDNWVQYVQNKLRQAGKTSEANMIRDFDDKITKYVSAVDKSTGEINFLKLESY